jgi:hypothetical protein
MYLFTTHRARPLQPTVTVNVGRIEEITPLVVTCTATGCLSVSNNNCISFQ